MIPGLPVSLCPSVPHLVCFFTVFGLFVFSSWSMDLLLFAVCYMDCRGLYVCQCISTSVHMGAVWWTWCLFSYGLVSSFLQYFHCIPMIQGYQVSLCPSVPLVCSFTVLELFVFSSWSFGPAALAVCYMDCRSYVCQCMSTFHTEHFRGIYMLDERWAHSSPDPSQTGLMACPDICVAENKVFFLEQPKRFDQLGIDMNIFASWME